jgi:cytokinin dehydrogenase
VISELARHIAGTVVAPVPGQWHRDFGNVHRRQPVALVQAARVADVQATIRYAARHGLRVVARGHGCSSGGQSLSDGLLLDIGGLTGLRPTGPDTVRVGAGTTWGQLQRELVAQGRTSAVVISSEQATLGGTLAVGGFGPTSLFAGALVDWVVGLDVVTGTGELVRLTPSGPEAELFDFTLCGLGSCAVIVGCELRVQPYRRDLLVQRYDEVDFAALPELAGELLAQDRWRTCRFVYANSGRRWRAELGRAPGAAAPAVAPSPALPGVGAAAAPKPVRDYHLRIFEAEAGFAPRIAAAQVQRGLLADASAACRVWGDFFLPAPEAARFWAEVGPFFADPVCTPVVNSALLRGAAAGRRLPLSPVPAAALVQTFGFYCVVPPDRVADYQARFDRAAAICHELGGRQYLHGHHRATEAFHRAQFGPETLRRWRAVRRRYDPAGILGATVPDAADPA